jgi:hypothetical protein
MSKDFQERIDALQSELDKCMNSESSSSCVPALLVLGAVVPILVWFVLYFVRPSIVTKENDSGELELCPKKVALWDIGITILVWGILYLLTYIPGFSAGLMCIFSKK